MIYTTKKFYIKLKQNKKYISCSALPQQNKIYNINFQRDKLIFNFKSYKNKMLNNYIIQKPNNNLDYRLKNILPDNTYELNYNNFVYNIKIKPDSQKYFLEKKINNQDQALDQAKLILNKFFLADTNNYFIIKKNNNELAIKFYNLIDGLINYSFPNEILFDKDYNLKQINYYDITYKKISSCKIKSFNQALNSLPKNFPAGTKINLNACNLTYIYSDSIIQPVYIFSGTQNNNANNSKEINFIIKASVY